MAKIGERAELVILKEVTFGVYLDGGDLGEVLLPRREAPSDKFPGDSVEVFLYTDSEDRPVATVAKPLAMPGEIARLKCVAVTSFGAFLDWGLPKDLMVPFREQVQRMQEGKQYLVHVRVDPVTDRIIASARITKALDHTPHDFKPGQKVELIIYRKTDLGYNAVVNGTHSGLIFADSVFQPLSPGEKTEGFIEAIREDGKLTVSLHAQRGQRVSSLEEQIISELEARGGYWAIGDHSPADEIREELGVSKRTFKQALGALLKKRQITIEERGIRKS